MKRLKRYLTVEVIDEDRTRRTRTVGPLADAVGPEEALGLQMVVSQEMVERSPVDFHDVVLRDFWDFVARERVILTEVPQSTRSTRTTPFREEWTGLTTVEYVYRVEAFGRRVLA